MRREKERLAAGNRYYSSGEELTPRRQRHGRHKGPPGRSHHTKGAKGGNNTSKDTSSDTDQANSVNFYFEG